MLQGCHLLQGQGLPEACYSSGVGFFGIQALMEHLRFPNAVRGVPRRHLIVLPSGSSNAKEMDKIWPCLKVLGL